MELENKKQIRHSRRRRLRNWFSRKQKEENNKPSCGGLYEIQGGADKDLSLRSLEFDPCILTNKLRVFVGTWNVAGRSPVGSLAVDLEDWLNLKNAADIYVLGFQEIVPLKTLNVIGAEDQAVATRWNNLISKILNNKLCCDGYSNRHLDNDSDNNDNKYYMLVASKKMVGVFVSVWLRQEAVAVRKCHVSNARVSSVACGVMGCLGNKGCVAVSMTVGGTSFCFVAAHLASGEKKGDEMRRNNQVEEIFRRTYFTRTTKDHDHHHPLTIMGHDRIFWFGDLNYRLYNLEDNHARNLIKKQDWKALQEFDQLQKELEEGGVFEGWKEGNIEFAPTYKYSSSISNRYCGGGDGGPQSKSWEKQRTPAWCDRILWYGKGVEQLHYIRSESKFSDHRPVSALFSTHIKINSPSSTGQLELHNIINPSTLLLHPNPGVNKEDEDGKSTLLSLLTKDIKGC